MGNGKTGGKSSEQSIDNSQRYRVSSVDLKSQQQVNSALNELNMLQQKVMLDYKDLANERLKYSDIDMNAAKAKASIKSCDDAYTISMLANCAAPLREGLTLGSVFSTMFTFKITSMMNPSFQQDIARIYPNMRENFISAAEQSNPFVRSAFMKFDKKMMESSTELFDSQINKNMSANTFDDMVMTPRQVAALKVNFMEQYYTDMRRCDANDNEKLDRLARSYDSSLKHLNAVASNGGFDMSVVAEEERYIVGLKIQQNPAYAAMFNETSGFYGVRPTLDSDKTWNGVFETWDNHFYTVGGDVSSGAFTVRCIQEKCKSSDGSIDYHERTKDNIESKLQNDARDIAAMKKYLTSSDFTVSDSKTKKEINAVMQKVVHDYKIRSVTMITNDLGVSEFEAKRIVKNNFVSHMNDCSNSNIKEIESEVHRIIDKECLAHYGIDYVDTDNPDDADRLMYSSLKFAVGRDDVRSGEEILKDMRYNYLESMSGSEIAALLLHAGTNNAQGRSRNDNQSETNKHFGRDIRSASENKLSPKREQMLDDELPDCDDYDDMNNGFNFNL
jgi:hypothetical protein